MISHETQDKLDRASEGLPMDDQQQQAEIDVKELAAWMNVSEDEAKGIQDEMDDRSADKEVDVDAEKYEQSRENDNSL